MYNLANRSTAEKTHTYLISQGAQKNLSSLKHLIQLLPPHITSFMAFLCLFFAFTYIMGIKEKFFKPLSIHGRGPMSHS
jgi:hypothetical protein